VDEEIDAQKDRIMADETTREVYRALREIQDRHTYFLLAAVGAALGLAVSQTQGKAIAWSQLPLGLAALNWGLSFFCGCRHLAYVGSTIYGNADLLQIQAGVHPRVGQHPQMIAAAESGVRSALETNASRANRYGHWQFRLFVAGALFYIAWHVLGMYLIRIGRAVAT